MTLFIKDWVPSRQARDTMDHNIPGKEEAGVSCRNSQCCLWRQTLSWEQLCSGHGSEPPEASGVAQTESLC